jgi:hypothetical protein
MALKVLLIRRGDQLRIGAIASTTETAGWDKCATLAFFQEQAQSRGSEMTKLAALLTETAQHGPPQDETKFKHLEGTSGLYEFKTGGGLRLLCFWDAGSLILCTHGYVKGRQKAAPSEIRRAARLKGAYFEAKRKGQLL